MSEWQPIETAPRDGTSILLYVVVQPGSALAFECDQPEGFAHFNIGSWDPGADDPDFGREPGWDTIHVGEPTHWMPLPEPPEAA